MADLSREELHRLAQLGAKARLEEIRREEASIRRSFPGLFGRGRGRAGLLTGVGAGPRSRRRGMSAAGRKAVSIRMKKYWAERRKAKGK